MSLSWECYSIELLTCESLIDNSHLTCPLHMSHRSLISNKPGDELDSWNYGEALGEAKPTNPDSPLSPAKPDRVSSS